TPAYRAHCRRLAQAIAPLIEQYLRRGDELILIGLDGSPSTGVRFTSSKPDWGGRPNRPEDDWEIVPRRGIWIEELEAELARRGLPPVPATGWALDMGRFDEAGSRRDLEQFLDSREKAVGSRGDDSVPSGTPTRAAGAWRPYCDTGRLRCRPAISSARTWTKRRSANGSQRSWPTTICRQRSNAAGACSGLSRRCARGCYRVQNRRGIEPHG